MMRLVSSICSFFRGLAMSKPKYVLDDEHFRAFGGIINIFARHEHLMVGVMAKLLGASIFYVSMITSELPYRGKRDTLLAMIKARGLSKTQIEKISGFLGQLHKYNKLRNAIAHSSWKEGSRPESVKPFGMSVRSGDTTVVGMDDEEPDYTAEELINIANELITLRDRFHRYLMSEKLLPDALEETIDLLNSRKPVS
jgi:hypothetical protein